MNSCDVPYYANDILFFDLKKWQQTNGIIFEIIKIILLTLIVVYIYLIELSRFQLLILVVYLQMSVYYRMLLLIMQ